MSFGQKFDLVIAGGGPAGSSAAIAGARAGARVLLLDRGRFPRHKVCGEFLSPEGLAQLRSIAPTFENSLFCEAPRIARARIFVDSTRAEVPIDPPGASITRYHLDHVLWRAAEACHVVCRQQMAVEKITGSGPFTVSTPRGHFEARAVIVAAGRWSNLRHQAQEQGPERWVGLKAHYLEARPSWSVDLYFFDGGYCGAQPIGRDRVNVCAMVRTDIATTLEQVITLHPELEQRSHEWLQISPPVSTAPLVFNQPVAEEGGVFYVGDAAGFIDPFVGDGISIAVRTGTMAANALTEFWSGGISLKVAADGYRECYQQEILPLFRNAFLLRKILSLPAALRRPLVGVLHAAPFARFLAMTTRGTVEA
ncbi:MAG TPA: FAD-dependent oxidoreductase [Terriglobales bacterium]|jgi:flavin-dependent dehydrogenase|nr:FAD-dependent oxidoreductase [Terriglobales bacterium]